MMLSSTHMNIPINRMSLSSCLSDFDRGAECWYGNAVSAVRITSALWHIVKIPVETDRIAKLNAAIHELVWGIVGLIPIVGQITFRIRNLQAEKNHCRKYVKSLSELDIAEETARLQKQERLTQIDRIYLETLLLPSKEKIHDIVRTEVPSLQDCALHVKKVTETLFVQSTPSLKELSSFPPLSDRVKKLIVNPRTPWQPQIDIDKLSILQRSIFQLVRGETLSLDQLPQKKELLMAVVAKQDQDILGEARKLVQQLLIDVHAHLLQEKNKEKIFHLEAIVAELLSFYPFLHPLENCYLQVPILDASSKWKLVRYTVKTIPLTQESLGSQMTAYGLVAEDAPPLLLFKGTTYPADKGFALSVLTDLNPIHSVGGWAHHRAKTPLTTWFEANTQSQKARVFGKSLGGSLSLLTAIQWPEKIETVTTYGAPGLRPVDNQQLQTLKEQGRLPKIQAFCQEGDPVPYTDAAAPSGIDYYLVLGNKELQGPRAHAEMYTLHAQSAILHLDPYAPARQSARTAMTTLRFVLSITLFPLLSVGYAGYLASRHSWKKLSSLPSALSKAR